MSDEKIEQQEINASTYGLSETPLGGPGAEGDEPTMEDAMAALDNSKGSRTLNVGDVVESVVVHIDKDGVLVDVGTKSEGSIAISELSGSSNLSPEEIVSVGDKIKVYVLQSEGREGGPILSKKRADFENAWDKLERLFDTKETFKAMVTDKVKGGLVVDLGIRGFVPASHVGGGKSKNLDKYIGQSLQFKVIEVDRERRKVVLSNRIAVDEEREVLKKETWGSIAEGQIKEGVVRRLTDYGAFVDLGGVDGLLHISEMSWTRIAHPSEAVKVGQKIQVVVLKLNAGEGRVSLGLRQILPDPWEDIKRKYKVGDTLTVKITRIVPFGAFCEIEAGVEAIIPNSELALKRVNKPEDVVNIGDEVEVRIIDVRAEERRMTLSMRSLLVQKQKDQEDEEFKSYNQHSKTESKTTIGDLIGGQLEGLSSSYEEEKPAEVVEEKVEAVAEVAEEAIAEPVVEVTAAEEAVEATVVEEVKAEEPAEVSAEVVEEVVPEETTEAPTEESVSETEETKE